MYKIKAYAIFLDIFVEREIFQMLQEAAVIHLVIEHIQTHTHTYTHFFHI